MPKNLGKKRFVIGPLHLEVCQTKAEVFTEMRPPPRNSMKTQHILVVLESSNLHSLENEPFHPHFSLAPCVFELGCKSESFKPFKKIS